MSLTCIKNKSGPKIEPRGMQQEIDTFKYDQYEKRIKQKTSMKEESKQLDINLFHSTISFLYTLKTTSSFQVFSGCKNDQLHKMS